MRPDECYKDDCVRLTELGMLMSFDSIITQINQCACDKGLQKISGQLKDQEWGNEKVMAKFVCGIVFKLGPISKSWVGYT